MKKFRGQSRYYHNLENTVDNYCFCINDSEWYDMWHIHIDFHGYSNYSIKHHRKHIVFLIRLFQKILESSRQFPHPYQTWVYINKEDGSQDAIYFHTQNPHNTQFPMKFPEICWEIKTPELLKDLINLEIYDLGYAQFPSGDAYIIKSKNQGESL